MILIYAYIKKFRNYLEQEICFDSSYHVKFSDGRLSISFLGKSTEEELIRGAKKPDNLHLLVGKTGSGKTNLLQLIGSSYDTRSQRKWDGEEDSYFMLYKINEKEFFLEICDVDIRQFPAKKMREDRTMPDFIKENARRMDTLRTVRFSIKRPPAVGETADVFTEIQEYGYKREISSLPARDMALVINCYDIHAFARPPYEDERRMHDAASGSWITRMILPYHRTSLWRVCDYIRDYLTNVEPGDGKRKVSLVLSTHNFAEKYPLKLPEAVDKEYWTFYEMKQDEQRAVFDEDARKRLRGRKKKKELTNKQMFLHDLWADYGKYLRKWAEKIQSYTAEEKIPEENLDASGTQDVYQEFLDYYTEKEYSEDIDAAVLPDGEKLSIVKRCIWLAEYIDRKDTGDPHGLLWQIMDDVRDIGNFLSKLDEKYFTVDTCTIPVVDMALPEYRELFEDLFERMEQYTPDDAGIFTEALLPYELTCLSTGEYQYAKVLGGMEDYLAVFARSRGQKRNLDKIILLDEPEAYMHPELARQFLSRLYRIMEKHSDSGTVQVIISTHSPFMLSDVLPQEITRLDIDRESGNAIVKNGSEKEYFGANIYTILADGFFLDYTIGEYSRNFLQDTYWKLITCKRQKISGTEGMSEFLASVGDMVPHIGDRLIRKAFEIALEELDAPENFES